ncbi:hypothetical protein [Actinomycetospora callitridis]|uniref:hypothetical protein n=1 Tax=Actinomycetospora callitridis TaxID=913944 RepID=UPI0023667F82|nr:hypothetical protein [Actinomycetospora callitridis]MDD7917633.1 hypothetical protein [Actinomycetospora callitridis]
MNGVESGRETAERSPVFVDASGRRRRGVTVLGYLGASACTAYLAAFGITLSTHASVIDASGVALAPSPSIDDEGGEEFDDVPADVVVPASATGRHGVTDAAVTTHASQKSTSRHASTAGGRHAAAPHVTAPIHRATAPLVPLRVVRGPASAGGGAAHATSPRPTTPHGGSVPGTPQSTPDPSSTTDGSGGSSSSGGAGPTTGTGTSGSTGNGGTAAGSGTTTDTTTDTTTPTDAGSGTPAVLDIGPLTTSIGV